MDVWFCACHRNRSIDLKTDSDSLDQYTRWGALPAPPGELHLDKSSLIMDVPFPLTWNTQRDW